MRRKIGFPAGLLLFALALLVPAPAGLPPAAQRAGAVALLMAAWWVTEAVPIAVTALVPLAAFPFLSISSMAETAPNYANPNVFLFMGGFMIALAMQKWQLHRRLALHVIAAVGAGPRALIAGFMLATAVISMWASNTATTVMMLPIGMAVLAQMGAAGTDTDGDAKRLGLALMLGIAYAASIGGAATLVGTPPNVIFAGQAKALFPAMGEVGFVRWFLFAFPLSAGFLLIAWAYLAFAVAGAGGGRALPPQAVQGEIRRLGPWSGPEKGVLAVFALTALGWITREDLRIGSVTLRGWSTAWGLTGIHDGAVAMLGALALFVIPARLKEMEFLLDWEWAGRLPWGVLLLFGGGFALAEGFERTGLAGWLGNAFAGLQGLPAILIVWILCLLVTFSSEVTSNTAQATLLMPVLAAASAAMGLHPYLLMVPATVATSYAFMLPSGTPPNAIVLGSGAVTIPQMAKAGLVLNLLGSLWITGVTFLLMKPVFGVAG